MEMEKSQEGKGRKRGKKEIWKRKESEGKKGGNTLKEERSKLKKEADLKRKENCNGIQRQNWIMTKM